MPGIYGVEGDDFGSKTHEDGAGKENAVKTIADKHNEFLASINTARHEAFASDERERQYYAQLLHFIGGVAAIFGNCLKLDEQAKAELEAAKELAKQSQECDERAVQDRTIRDSLQATATEIQESILAHIYRHTEINGNISDVDAFDWIRVKRQPNYEPQHKPEWDARKAIEYAAKLIQYSGPALIHQGEKFEIVHLQATEGSEKPMYHFETVDGQFSLCIDLQTEEGEIPFAIDQGMMIKTGTLFQLQQKVREYFGLAGGDGEPSNISRAGHLLGRDIKILNLVMATFPGRPLAQKAAEHLHHIAVTETHKVLNINLSDEQRYRATRALMMIQSDWPRIEDQIAVAWTRGDIKKEMLGLMNFATWEKTYFKAVLGSSYSNLTESIKKDEYRKRAEELDVSGSFRFDPYFYVEPKHLSADEY